MNNIEMLKKINKSESDIVELNEQLEQIENDIDCITTLIYPTDTSDEIQAKLNKSGNIIFTDGIYNLDFSDNSDNKVCLSIKSNTTINFENNAIIQCVANSYDRYYIIELDNVENVTINGGKIIGDRTSHTSTTGEWGYGIRVTGGKNIEINKTEITNCWGDGICVAGNTDNLKLINTKTNNNRRNGITLAYCKNFLLDGCESINTNGTLPEAGLCIEPDNGMKCENGIVTNCNFSYNNGNGILIEGGHNTIETTLVNNIILSNNICNNNVSNGIELLNTFNNDLKNNLCNKNTKNGIFVGSSFDNDICNNRCDYNNYGISISETNNSNYIKCNVSNYNKMMGISLYKSNAMDVISNTCRYNGSHGIGVAYGKQNKIINNSCVGNGQNNDNTNSSNITVYSDSDYNLIQGNSVSKGDKNIYTNHGISVRDSTSSDNICINNNCFNGGAVSGIKNTGTGTTFGSGNIVLLGNWSSEPS